MRPWASLSQSSCTFSAPRQLHRSSPPAGQHLVLSAAAGGEDGEGAGAF